MQNNLLNNTQLFGACFLYITADKYSTKCVINEGTLNYTFHSHKQLIPNNKAINKFSISQMSLPVDL